MPCWPHLGKASKDIFLYNYRMTLDLSAGWRSFPVVKVRIQSRYAVLCLRAYWYDIDHFTNLRTNCWPLIALDLSHSDLVE